jgi:hypothetical protein
VKESEESLQQFGDKKRPKIHQSSIFFYQSMLSFTTVEAMVKGAMVALFLPLFWGFIKNLMYLGLHPPKHGKLHPCDFFHFVNTCHLHIDQ